MGLDKREFGGRGWGRVVSYGRGDIVRFRNAVFRRFIEKEDKVEGTEFRGVRLGR